MRSRDELPNPYASGLESAGDRSAAVHYLLAGAVTAGVAGGLAMTGVAVADEGLDAEPSSGQVERAGAEEGPAGDAPPENEQWESVPPDREPDEPDDESSTPDPAGAPTPAPGTEDAEPAPAVEEPGAGFVAGVESALAVQRSTFESRIAAIRAATEAAERSRAHPDEDAVPPEAEVPPAEVPQAEVPQAEQPPVVEVPPAEDEPQAEVPPVVEVPPLGEPSAEEPPPAVEVPQAEMEEPAAEVPYVDVPPQVGAPLAEVPSVETEVLLESGGAGPEEAVQAPAEGPVSADPYRPGQPDSSPALHSVDDGGDDGGDHGGDDGDHGGDDGDQDGDAPDPDVVEEIAGIEAAIAVDWTRTSGSILDFARSVARVAQERDNELSTEEEQPEQPPVPEAEDPHGHDPHLLSAHGVDEDDLVPSPALTAERVSGPPPDGDSLLAQAWGWVSRMIGDLWDDYDAILDPLEARLGIADADEDAVRVPPALTVVGGTGGGR